MADRSGKQLGNYHLLRLLGKGGFAEVYLGEHIYLKTPVAVKLLHTQLENEDMTGFLTEAQMIARLQHAHIVRVTDFGMDGDLPYLVMDFAPNGTLRERHPRGSLLPTDTVSSYVKQIAEALQYAHDEKLIHRDIKPENMLLARTNSVLLSDFGIATVAHRTSTQNTSIIAGTAVYMSPELFRGKSYPASDQYALGVVVYEWLCGQPPFYEGDFIQLGYQHTYVPPDPLSEKVPSISKDVEHVVNVALAKDPKQRFGSVQAFANAFEQASQSRQLNPSTLLEVQSIAISEADQANSVAILPPDSTSTSFTQEDVPQMEAASILSSGYIPSSYTTEEMPQTDRANLPPLSPVQHEKNTLHQETTPITTETPSERTTPNTEHVPENADEKVNVIEKKNEQVNIWKIGKQQMIAALIGFALVACLGILTGLSITYPYSVSAATGVICLFLFAVASEFFGAVFGPLIGLFTGVGLLVAYITLTIKNTDFQDNFPIGVFWPIQLGFILVGFISGFALLKTKGRYNIVGTLVFSSLGVVVGTTSTIIGGYQYSYPYNDYFISSFLHPELAFALAYLIVGLILLPILRVLYYKITTRIRHA